MPATSRSTAALLMVAAVLVAAGCGGGHSGSGSAGPVVLFVDGGTTVTATARDGSAAAPFRRISDGLAAARTIRATSAAPIVVRVAAGTYVGSYTTTGTAELLPLFLNVPDLELRGTTALPLDADSLPTGIVTATATVIVATPGVGGVAGSGTPLQSVVVIGPAGRKLRLPDGSIVPQDGTVTRGDGVTLDGFVIDAGNPPTAVGGVGITVHRARDFAVRGNIVRNASIGVQMVGASGVVEGNFIVGNGLAVGPGGGNAAAPASVVVQRNRLLANNNGAVLPGATGTAGAIPAHPALALAAPAFDGIYDSLFVEIANNDLSENVGAANQGFGLRFFVVGPSAVPASVTPCATPADFVSGSIVASVHDNRLVHNRFAVMIDGGFPYRANLGVTDCRRFGGTYDLSFARNTIATSVSTNALITLTRNTSALNPTQLTPGPGKTSFQYLEGARFTVHDPEGELSPLWIDHPVTDPVDGRVLGNRLTINGSDVPAPTRTVP
jgi:hypothetical protein